MNASTQARVYRISEHEYIPRTSDGAPALRTGWREQRSVTRLLEALDRYLDSALAGTVPAWYAAAVGREIIGALEEMGVAR